MNAPALDPNANIIEVDMRVTHCIVRGCGGAVVRHSLGGAQSVDRCTRCFRRYQVRPALQRNAEAREPGRIRRFLNEFVSWRD